jgi:hypothetical protein
MSYPIPRLEWTTGSVAHSAGSWNSRLHPYDPGMNEALSKEELEAAHCWETGDRVPGRPEMTEFRRRVRYHQARWREAKGHPIGSQPIAPRKGERARLVGSRLPLGYARETGANFVTAAALEAVQARTSVTEPRQSFDHQRLWADLLWSPTMAFNLFGDLAADLGHADRLVHTLWPDVPGAVSEIRFAHSPGWLDPTYLNNLRVIDAAVVLDLGDGSRGVVGIDVKYHEWTKPETPRPSNLRRYLDVSRRSGAFAPGALDRMKGKTDLAVMWLEHLLVLSMLQHASGTWRWGRYVIVHPAANTDFAVACVRYRALLADQSSFSSMTLEELFDAGALPTRAAAVLRERYLPSS